ncbi:hypothetical protein DFH08DRAFT_361173 [Mycena albidolilacea]|uniref:Uncharacterized protein n=1 Tax=Mycena albidolilacea TaxID=1033008 RepID=A0AAD7AJV5_9AGAR|nr:hypothetical protein DFH08DRAFT_361173 [Mycena albidolilacea]
MRPRPAIRWRLNLADYPPDESAHVAILARFAAGIEADMPKMHEERRLVFTQYAHVLRWDWKQARDCRRRLSATGVVPRIALNGKLLDTATSGVGHSNGNLTAVWRVLLRFQFFLARTGPGTRFERPTGAENPQRQRKSTARQGEFAGAPYLHGGQLDEGEKSRRSLMEQAKCRLPLAHYPASRNTSSDRVHQISLSADAR